MRQYKIERPSNESDVPMVTLFELGYYAESYGFTSEEFEQLTDMERGQMIEIANVRITRIDKPG